MTSHNREICKNLPDEKSGRFLHFFWLGDVITEEHIFPGYNEAIPMMEEESGYIILDVRTPEEFAEKHIPGAINVANETIGTDEIPEVPDKDQLILV